MKIFACCNNVVKQAILDGCRGMGGVQLTITPVNQLLGNIKENEDVTVILDIDDDYEAMRQLVKQIRWAMQSPHDEIPVLIISGNLTKETVFAYRDAGASFFLAKPFSPAQVQTSIKRTRKSERAFVRSPFYRGPDRRFRELMFRGEERRTGSPGGTASNGQSVLV